MTYCICSRLESAFCYCVLCGVGPVGSDSNSLITSTIDCVRYTASIGIIRKITPVKSNMSLSAKYSMKTYVLLMCAIHNWERCTAFDTSLELVGFISGRNVQASRTSSSRARTISSSVSLARTRERCRYINDQHWMLM